MRKIIAYLNDYRQREFHSGYVLSVILFMGLYVYIEYAFQISAEYRNHLFGTYQSWMYSFFSFWVPLTVAYLLYSMWKSDWQFWKSYPFLFLLLFAPAVFSLRTWSNQFSGQVYDWIPEGRTAQVYFKCTMFLIRDALVVIPVVIYWLLRDRRQMPLYGLTLKNYNLKPYLGMLVLMAPLIAAASFQGDFLDQYPKGFSLAPLSIEEPGDRKYFILYELFYGFDFFVIEFFFRGFLLLAMFPYFGWKCLIPMACFYVSIHFGKPLGETISSFFGGTLLGIIAIRSGSVAGGIVVHLGIAWMMELAALIHKLI